MKASDNCKDDARESLAGVIFFGILGLSYIAIVVIAHISGAEIRGGWLWDVLMSLVLFGGSTWGFINYRNDKKDQRELEKSEAEEEKYRLTVANKQ